MATLPSPRKASGTAKAFVAQVQAALRSSARPTPTLHGVDCSRLWVQGVVVARDADTGECALDDGTGLALVDMKVFLKNTPPGLGALPAKGDYIMVIGPLQKKLMQQQQQQQQQLGGDAPLRVLAHQVVQLDAKQQREAVWFLEVVEYWTAVAARDATTA